MANNAAHVRNTCWLTHEEPKTVQIIYAFPFFVMAAIACVIFLSAPRLRPHALSAFAAPLGFGAASIIGTALLMAMIDKQYESLPRFVQIGAPLFAYIGAGLVGGWIAVKSAQLVKSIHRKFSHGTKPE